MSRIYGADRGHLTSASITHTHCTTLCMLLSKWFLTAFETLNLLTYLLTYVLIYFLCIVHHIPRYMSPLSFIVYIVLCKA